MARELDESDLGRLGDNRECASDTNSDLYSELSSADRHEGSSSDDPVCTEAAQVAMKEGFQMICCSLRAPEGVFWPGGLTHRISVARIL